MSMDEKRFKKLFGDFDDIKACGELEIGDILEFPEGTTQTITAYDGETTVTLPACRIRITGFEYNEYQYIYASEDDSGIYYEATLYNTTARYLYKFGAAYSPVVKLVDGTEITDWAYFRVPDEKAG